MPRKADRNFEDMAGLFEEVLEKYEHLTEISLTQEQFDKTIEIIKNQKFPSKFKRLELITDMTRIIEDE